MRTRDTFDVGTSLAAVVGDALAVFSGFLAATWLRFNPNLFSIPYGIPTDLRVYSIAAAVVTVPLLLVYWRLGLYVRPQTGLFGDRIPRLVRATGIGTVITTVMAFAVKNILFEFSTGVLLISFFTVSGLVIVERFLLFRAEIAMARHASETSKIIILGTNEVAAHLRSAIGREPRLRSTVVGFLRTGAGDQHAEIPQELIKGTDEELRRFVEGEGHVDQVILTDADMDRKRILDIILLCERNLVVFKLVPDIFRILTWSVDVQTIDDIPLLGVSRWPLDFFWNRIAKRIEDVLGSVVGLVLTAPLVGLLAFLIKRDSPGPLFYRQERCGDKGKSFNLYKLRTMKVGAEAESGPVWAAADDPRRTRVGAFLRRHNLDELPQFWNVLKGEMSLVGPRPERPHFVEQFREDISGYMWRHMSKPGMTGWAQVNGLRGNTSIKERIKCDLYYLENWSLSFDFKILVRTLFASKNAY